MGRSKMSLSTSDDELRALYEQPMSTSQIAVRLGVSRKKITSALRGIGVEIRSSGMGAGLVRGCDPFLMNVGNPLGTMVCPVSLSKLRQLYEEEAMSTRRIGEYCARVVNRTTPFKPQVVNKWLRKANIPLRLPGHGIAIYLKDPLARRERSLKCYDQHVSGNLTNRPFTRKEALRASRLSANKCRSNQTEVRCSNPYCTKLFRVPPSRLRAACIYCSKECASADASRRLSRAFLVRKIDAQRQFTPAQIEQAQKMGITLPATP